MSTSLSVAGPSKVSSVVLTQIQREQTGTTRLNVTWVTPQSDLPISEYEVQFRCGVTSWSSISLTGSPPATSTIVTELNASTECTLRVRAVSEIGAGEWSDEQTVITSDSEYASTVIQSLCTCGPYSIFSVMCH